MMKLIDADALLVALRDYWAEGTNETGMEVLDKIIVSLENKGADAEPIRHGKWIYKEFEPSKVGVYVCSECGYVAFNEKSCHYCYNCGARMDEDDESEA